MVASVGVGFLCSGLSVAFFGICFTPVKKIETGDGVFFQWILCAGIFFIGVLVNLIKGFHFFSFATFFGGALWTTGNLMTVPIIQILGLGLGTLLYGITNMLMGWAAGSFGLFGLKKNEISNPILNYAGVVLALVSLYVYLRVKPGEAVELSPIDVTAEDDQLLSFLASPLVDDGPKRKTINGSENPVITVSNGEEGSHTHRVLGIIMALTAGVFFGSSLIPMQHTIDHGGDDRALNYVFSLFSGIFSASTGYFLVYVASRQIRRKKPFIRKTIVVPGLISGLFWGVADTCWLVANESLGFSVAFPIITTGPGFVALLLGIFWFKEIQGTKNYILITVAFITTTVAVTCIGKSR